METCTRERYFSTSTRCIEVFSKLYAHQPRYTWYVEWLFGIAICLSAQIQLNGGYELFSRPGPARSMQVQLQTLYLFYNPFAKCLIRTFVPCNRKGIYGVCGSKIGVLISTRKRQLDQSKWYYERTHNQCLGP